MKRIAYLSREVRALFDELEEASRDFFSLVDVRCPATCHECCLNSAVQATVLEFVPLACRLMDEGRAEEVLGQLEGSAELKGCVFAGIAGCSVYPDRGLICRLFAASVRKDRQDRLEYIACSLLHARHGRYLPGQTPAPVITDWGLRLEAIDPAMGCAWYPVNEAIRRALEIVLHTNHLDRAG